MKLKSSLKMCSIKKQEKLSRKKHLSKEAIRKKTAYTKGEGFICVPERMKTTQITKRHLMQLRLKLENLKEVTTNSSKFGSSEN